MARSGDGVDDVDDVDALHAETPKAEADRLDGDSSESVAPRFLDPDVIERLRRSGIRIDGAGTFQHEGAPVTHEGLRRALFRWLDRLPDGRTILRLDAQRFVYVDVDDTPLVVRAARIDGDTVLLALSDGVEETLDPSTLTIDDRGVMRCLARGGRLPARLATSAATILADLIDDRPGGPVLTLGDRELLLRPPTAVRP